MKRRYLWALVILSIGVVISLALASVASVSDRDAVRPSASAATGNMYVFRLELDGELPVEYEECFGLGSRNAVEEETMQAPNGVEVRQKIPGVLEWGDITLKRTGPTPGGTLWAWRKSIEEGDFDSGFRDGFIVMLKADTLALVARWKFHDGWPSRLTLGGSSEQITIVHAGVERVAAFIPVPPRR